MASWLPLRSFAIQIAVENHAPLRTLIDKNTDTECTGTSDFWSFDPYTAGFATSPPNGIDACASNSSDPNWPMCVMNTNVQQDGWLNGQASYAYAYIAPQYVRQQFGYVWDTFRPSGILVAEFGFNPFMEYAKVSLTVARTLLVVSPYRRSISLQHAVPLLPP